MNRRIAVFFTYLILILFSAICLYPFVWMIGTSLKTSTDALGNPASFIPNGALQFVNYQTVWQSLKVILNLWNSIANSVAVSVCAVIIYSMMGFALSLIRFHGRKVIFYMFIALMLVPGLAMVIPVYINMNSYGLTNTFLGLILPAINGAAPFAVFLYRNYFGTIPRDMYEASQIDGASKLRIYAQIYFPLALPISGTVAIINFLSSWNAILWPMIILNDQKKFTLPLAIMQMNHSAFTQWNLTMAGSVVAIIPILLAFSLLQRFYIQGLVAGAVKG